ncbi:MAG TPA: ubiquinol-cytochrome c reductase iron-sulfur subunit [Bacteroidetes bacterium]|nr:ubiquinol-cytochrome c reductase iron-sulfur subunit [Bacteroidota bacterium]
MKRKEFLVNLFSFVPLTLGFLGITKMSVDFLTPEKGKVKLRKIFAISLDDLSIGESKEMTDLRGKNFLLIRTGKNKVKALSTTCTHLGCTVYWQQDKNRFYCPCHQGVFNPDGEVVSGPPPRKLDSYSTEIIGNNVYIYLKDKDA